MRFYTAVIHWLCESRCAFRSATDTHLLSAYQHCQCGLSLRIDLSKEDEAIFSFPLSSGGLSTENHTSTQSRRNCRVSSSTGHAVVNHNSVPCYKNATPFLFMSTGCSYSLTTTQPWNEATQIPFHINEGGWVLQTILWNSVNLKRKITFYNSQMVHLPSHPFFL